MLQAANKLHGHKLIYSNFHSNTISEKLSFNWLQNLKLIEWRLKIKNFNFPSSIRSMKTKTRLLYLFCHLVIGIKSQTNEFLKKTYRLIWKGWQRLSSHNASFFKLIFFCSCFLSPLTPKIMYIGFNLTASKEIKHGQCIGFVYL